MNLTNKKILSAIRASYFRGHGLKLSSSISTARPPARHESLLAIHPCLRATGVSAVARPGDRCLHCGPLSGQRASLQLPARSTGVSPVARYCTERLARNPGSPAIRSAMEDDDVDESVLDLASASEHENMELSNPSSTVEELS